MRAQEGTLAHIWVYSRAHWGGLAQILVHMSTLGHVRVNLHMYHMMAQKADLYTHQFTQGHMSEDPHTCRFTLEHTRLDLYVKQFTQGHMSKDPHMCSFT